MFKDKILRIALESFIITIDSTKVEISEHPTTSKSIISGRAITSTDKLGKDPISSEIGSTIYHSGKTLCIFTGRGHNIEIKDQDGKELKHRVVAAVNYKEATQNVMRIQTAALSTAAADEKDLDKASGAKFTCYKKGETAITLEDLKQGLQGAVNSIVDAPKAAPAKPPVK